MILFKAYSDYLDGQPNDRVYTLPQSKLKGIKSYPFIYWISDEFREKFAEYPLSKEASVISGFKTGKNVFLSFSNLPSITLADVNFPSAISL